MVKRYQHFGISWIYFGRALFLLVSCFGLFGANVAAASYAMEYSVDKGANLAAGTVLVSSGGASVRAASQNDGHYVLGVVAPVIEGSLTSNNVGVVSSGVTPVLVSDINGDVKSGDRVAVSPISGVGMKASSPGWIIGTAQADFDSKADGVVRQQIKTPNSQSKSISIETIPVLVSVSYYNPMGQTSGAINTIQSAAQTVTGHPVSTTRAIIALIVFSIAIILLVVLVYSAVKNSLTAIGRNPLASGKISASLIKILLTAVIVIVFTLIIIYFILR